MLNLKTIFSRESPKFDLIIKKIYEQKTKKLKTNINIRAKDTPEKHLTIKILTKVFIFIFFGKRNGFYLEQWTYILYSSPNSKQHILYVLYEYMYSSELVECAS